MISLKKYIEGSAQESVRVLSESYRASLTAVGVSATQICPHLGEDFQRDLSKLQDALGPESPPEAMAQTGKQVEEEIAKWGKTASEYLQQTANQVKEIMLIVAETAQAVAERDQRYARQFVEFAEQLSAIGNLEDLGKVRLSLGKSAHQLKTYVEKLVEDGEQSVSRLRAEVSVYQTRLDEVERVATRDPVTGVANRYKAERQLQFRVEHCGKETNPRLSVAIFDLDNFKQINDEYGHPAGDELLAQFATELRGAFRSTDLVSRWGGDEFLVIVDCNAEEACKRIDPARKWVDGEYTVKNGGNVRKVTVRASLGVASWKAGETAAELVGRADAAMYQEKARNRQAAKGLGKTAK
jgi:diguanylate cyclase (GGDEF)-like protein